MERARGGDAGALDELLKLLQPQIYRFGMKMCRHPEDAEEVLQDTMLTIAHSHGDFRGASSFSTWLYTIARSFCIKKRRKSKFAPEIQESLDTLDVRASTALESTELDPHAQAESRELWQGVQAAVDALDPAHREVLLLRDVEGLTAKEVAEVLGVGVAAVKSRLHRARASVRAQLAGAPSKLDSGCPDIRAIFSQHLEGDLPSDVCATMDAHVASCPACASECEGLKRTLDLCRSTPCAALPGECRERVDAAIRKTLDELTGQGSRGK